MYLDINQSAISYMDLKNMKSVKVMVEKLDIHNLLIIKSNKIFNWEKTLKNGLNEYQTECSTPNASIDDKKKFSSSTNVDADINLQGNGIKSQSPTDIPLMKKSKSRFFSSDEHSRTKKKRGIDSSDISKNKILISDSSIRPSPILECNYFDAKVNINSNTVIKSKLPKLSQSLNSFNLSASKDLSKFKTHDLKVSKEFKLNNVLISKPSLNLRKSYKLRNQSITTKDNTSKPNNSSR